MKQFSFILFLLLIFSCENLSLETDSIVVKAIDNGTVLASGDSFDISFSKTRESVIVSPTSANVIITYNTDYKNFESELLTVEPIEFSIDIQDNPNPQLQITDDFVEGLYDIEIIVYENDSIITEYSSKFIVYSGVLSGEISALYPLDNIYTDSKIILESKIIYDDYIDPYLVWTINGESISEGYLSEGYNSIIWDTEQRYGFMDIHLNLFPYKILDSIDSDSVVDFSFIVNPLDKNLYDGKLLSHYKKLLYFNGNYIDEADRFLSSYNYEDPSPLIYDKYYGMEIGSDLGFITSDSIFPDLSEEGLLKNFSLIIDFFPLDSEDGYLIKTSNGSLNSDLYVENGSLQYSYGFENVIELGTLDINTATKVVISYVVSENGYNIFYYYNGELINSSDWEIINDDKESVEESSFQVGGSSDIIGFSAILSNISVYVVDDYGFNNIYPDNLKDEVGNSTYKIINGFNSVYTPNNFYGEGSSNGELLFMESLSYLSYIDTLPLNSDYEIIIQGEGDFLLGFNNDYDAYEYNILGECIVKKRGNNLFINDFMIEDWDNTKSSFSITAQEQGSLDYVIVESMERVFESK